MKIAFLGDFAAFEYGLLNTDWVSGLKDIKEYLSAFDLVVANLEVPITNEKTTKVLKGIHLKTDVRIIKVLKYLGIDAVCLANNHICDFGVSGMKSTIEELERAGIEYFGVNGKSYLYSQNNIKLGFQGFCCYSTNGSNYKGVKGRTGVNELSLDYVKKEIDEFNSKGYMPVLSFHWGDEYSYYPNKKQIKFVDKITCESKCVLVGHHTHVMQGVEIKNDSIVAYSLGNFYFDDCISPINSKLKIKQSDENRESFILILDIESNEEYKYNTQGIYFKNFGVTLLDNNVKLDSISKLIKFNNTEDYKNKSKEMIDRLRSNNLAKHDLKWLISKLNYHSIGAKIISYYYKRKYDRAY